MALLLDILFSGATRKNSLFSSEESHFFKRTRAFARECVCVCIHLHVILWKMIKWQDELWSMSCWQNTSDRVERESLDRPGPLLATGAGALQYKVHSVSVSHPQRTAAWTPLTSTTSGYREHFICAYSACKNIKMLIIQSLVCGKRLND